MAGSGSVIFPRNISTCITTQSIAYHLMNNIATNKEMSEDQKNELGILVYRVAGIPDNDYASRHPIKTYMNELSILGKTIGYSLT